MTRTLLIEALYKSRTIDLEALIYPIPTHACVRLV